MEMEEGLRERRVGTRGVGVGACRCPGRTPWGGEEGDSWCRRGRLTMEMARGLREVWTGRSLSRTAREGERRTVEARLFVPLWAVI